MNLGEINDVLKRISHRGGINSRIYCIYGGYNIDCMQRCTCCVQFFWYLGELIMAVKKQGRNKKKAASAAYLAEGRARKNKAKKIARHLKLHPNDSQTKNEQGKAVNYTSTKPVYDILGRLVVTKPKAAPLRKK